MSITGPKENGRNTYRTQVSKFLYGGRLDNLLKGHDKIVNGMEDPSFFAFMFGIEPDVTGLFAIPGDVSNNIYDLNTDRNYGVLTYLSRAINPNTSAMVMNNSSTETNISANQNGSTNTFANLDLLYHTNEGGILEPDTQNNNVQLTFPQELVEMSKFVNGFKDITINHPYMMQSIEGLQDAYKKFYNMHKDAYLGGNDTKIKIKCLEAMDLRMSALFDSYFKSVYNHKYRRMNIPRNLLRFNCWVLVHDLRNLKIDQGSLLSAVAGSPVTEDIVENLSTILFRFKNCLFDIEDIGAMLGTVSNAEINQTVFEFVFNYTDVDVYVNSLADYIEAGSKANDESYRQTYDLLDIHTLNDELGTLSVSDIFSNIGSSIFNYATMGSTMGNVYEDSWAGILASMMSSISTGGVTGILNAAIGKGLTAAKSWASDKAKELVGKAQDSPTYTNTTVDVNRRKKRRGSGAEFDNVYDDSVISHELVEESNVYDDNTVSHETLQQENIYGDLTFNNNAELPFENIFAHENTSHETLQQDNVYSHSANSNHQLEAEPLLEEPSNGQQFLGGFVDMSTNGSHHTMTSGKVYDELPEPIPYIPEEVDMSTNGSHQQIEEGNVYSELPEEKHTPVLGNVYTITQTSVKLIPANVYDRIIESTKSDIPIEKIFIPPTKSPSLEIEFVDEPVKATKASTMEELNAYAENAKQKILNQIRSIGNIYY